MNGREELQEWVLQALKESGGSASILVVAKHIWKHREHELRASEDLFYTWQYDMRWACTKLRNAGIVRDATISPRGQWELIK